LITNAFPFLKNGLRKYFAFSILQALFNKVFQIFSIHQQKCNAISPILTIQIVH